jgi:hypothetical protein
MSEWRTHQPPSTAQRPDDRSCLSADRHDRAHDDIARRDACERNRAGHDPAIGIFRRGNRRRDRLQRRTVCCCRQFESHLGATTGSAIGSVYDVAVVSAAANEARLKPFVVHDAGHQRAQAEIADHRDRGVDLVVNRPHASRSIRRGHAETIRTRRDRHRGHDG